MRILNKPCQRLQIKVKLTNKFILILILMVVSTTTMSNEQIRQLELRIKQLKAQMYNARSQYGRLQQKLKDKEEQIGDIANRIRTLQNALLNKQKTLYKLKKQEDQIQIKLQAKRKILAKQITAAYVMGRQDYLKLWLNQEDVFSIGRILAYYDYFNRTKSNQIKRIKTSLKTLTTLEDTIKLKKVDINNVINKQIKKKQTLIFNYQQRKKILAQLANTLENQSTELKRLEDNKRHLETLLSTLDKAPKADLAGQINLANLKGKLVPPVKGRILKRFGDKLVADLKWQGMLIAAPLGNKVRVVAPGQVIFAQWFRNFGLLIIIDHGQSYMSLYAHNQSLYVKMGDWVQANDIIATVGNSGGNKISALYFEIRYQAKPQAPRYWLH
jgi:septal ring factor EnvC (AmiA/AmiB activator)